MKKPLMILFLTLVFAIYSMAEETQNTNKWKKQPITITPLSRTQFKITHKDGKEENVDLTGKKIIVVSVSEPGSEGRSYAIDEDGIIWWTDIIASGVYGGNETPSGIFPILLKRRYHMSATHPSADGVNNMDFEMHFTHQGHALHMGNNRGLSHGCVHLGKKDAQTMFNWVDLKTKVVIMRGSYRKFLNQEINHFKKSYKKYEEKQKKKR